jgi:peroxiredoxin
MSHQFGWSMGKSYFILFAVAVSLVICSCSKKNDKTVADSSVQIGSTAPDFMLTDVAGNNTTLSSYKGKIVLLEFWATWCPPCKASIPDMVELQKKYQDKGFTVLGVSIDTDSDAAAKVAEFSSSHGITYPVLIADEAVPMTYNVMSIPTSFLISRNGTVISSYIGYFDDYSKKISAEIEKHL